MLKQLFRVFKALSLIFIVLSVLGNPLNAQAKGNGKGKPKKDDQVIVPVVGGTTSSGSGPSCSATNILCVPSEYATMQACENVVTAGQTCAVSAGTYSERLSIVSSGSSSSNLITFLAVGSASFCGVDASSKNYRRFIGFTIQTNVGSCTKQNRVFDMSGTNTGWEFWNNTISGAYTGGITSGSYTDRHHNFIIFGNVFSGIGGGGTCGSAISLIGNDNYIAYNEFNTVDCDVMHFQGARNTAFNNYTHNVLDSGNQHADVLQTNASALGLTFTRFEANFTTGTNGALENEHGVLLQNQTPSLGAACGSPIVCGSVSDNLFRGNVWDNSGGVFGQDQAQVGSITGTKLVNETIYNAVRYQNNLPSSLPGSVLFNGDGGNTTSGSVHNSIFYKGWTDSITSTNITPYYTANGGTVSSADCNLAYTPLNTPTYAAPWTSQRRSFTNTDPLFTDTTLHDFSLQGAQVGCYLTTVASATSSGTSFDVASGGGGFFRGPNSNISAYGNTLTAGDKIMVGHADASTNTFVPATVVSVSGDTLTVTPSISWTVGDYVLLGENMNKDIGALPFTPGGFNLSASYIRNSTSVTVFPNEAALTRYVVCYEDGIPTTIDATAPYQCTVSASSSVTVRLYPLYASTTRYVNATLAAALFAYDCTPTNIKCVAPSGAEYSTIQAASTASAAGDTIVVAPGVYIEEPAIAVSGTSGNTITYLANGIVQVCRFSAANKSYVRMVGFTVDMSMAGCSSYTSAEGFVLSGTNTGLEFWNFSFQNNPYKSALTVAFGDRCHQCIVIGGTYKNLGGIGGVNGVTLTGNDGFIGYVDFTNVCYVGIVPSGNRIRMVNNKFHGMAQCGAFDGHTSQVWGGAHPDFIYPAGNNTFGFSNNLVEAWWGIGTSSSHDNKAMHVQTQTGPTVTNWDDNIWRYNLAYNMGSGYYSVYSSSTDGLINRFRFYNDTIVKTSQAQDQTDSQFATAGNLSSQAGNLSASLFNNIYVEGWTNAARTAGAVSGWSAGFAGSTITSNFNLLYDSRGTVTNGLPDANPQVNVNPQFVSQGTDFTLQSGSGARGTGGRLTTASGSGSSSSTLTVAANTGSFFVGSNASNLTQYGGALVPGDFITVGSTTVQVSSISGDVLTLATPISWSNGASVYYGPSSTIDIGAFPYKSGGYTLTGTYSSGGGTTTITPNDSSLVRFVVCYNNNIPYAVDSTSPYTCTTPASGTFSAYLYPRYASAILRVLATQ